MTHSEFQDYMGKSADAHLAVLQMLMKTIPVGVWYTNSQGEVIYVSEAWKRITGVSEDKITGKGYMDIIHPDDLQRVLDAMRTKVANPDGYDFEVEFRIRAADGKYKWLYSKAVTMDAHNGYPAGLVGITVDVDSRHAASTEAKMLWRAVEAASNPIIITGHQPDAEARNPVVYVNPAFEKFTGYTLDELRGKDPRCLHGEDDAQPSLEDIREAILSSKSISGVYVRNYKKNGEMYIAELNLSPIYSGGEITHWVGVQSLVTEQVRIKEIEELKDAIATLLQTTAALPT